MFSSQFSHHSRRREYGCSAEVNACPCHYIVNQMESNPDLKEINDKIKTACQLYLTEETKSLKRDGSKSKGKKGSMKGYSNQGSICDGRVTTMDNGGSADLEQEDISGDGTDAPDCQSYDRVSTCMHCDEICESAGGSQGSIYCDSCESWMQMGL